MKYIQHGTVAYTRPALGETEGTKLIAEMGTMTIGDEPTLVDVEVFLPELERPPEPGDPITITIEWYSAAALAEHVEQAGYADRVRSMYEDGAYG